jgi:excisionase family DNA binding protein
MHPDEVSITKAPLLKRQEAAEALNQSVRMVDMLIASGELPAVRIGRSVRVRPSAIEYFIEARESRVKVKVKRGAAR